ncbi:hypothetical protein [Halomarina litorea]|uniref:hypothetical protein n=1 Tax=Halomarina litorea TaxID=2961595 RepID=UPI0020C4D622|nr:hypothetical protein [Halomarina sp. BCD28]
MSDSPPSDAGDDEPSRGTDPGDFGADPEPEEFEHLPTSDIEVDLHVHFGMTGSFPLRLAELFFADDGLHVAEYAYLTPMFGLGMKKHEREADAMGRIFDIHGVDEVLLQADTVFWYGYPAVERIVVHDGGRTGRPRLAVHTTERPPHAYRLHDVEGDEDEFDEFVASLEACGERHGFAVDRKSGVGFSLRESLARFFVRY